MSFWPWGINQENTLEVKRIQECFSHAKVTLQCGSFTVTLTIQNYDWGSMKDRIKVGYEVEGLLALGEVSPSKRPRRS